MKLKSNQIQEIIPHRYPMLLIDAIEHLKPGVRAIGTKCVSVNEAFFFRALSSGTWDARCTYY